MPVVANPEPTFIADAASQVADELLASYLGDERARRISHRYLPSRGAIVEILESVLDLMYPGYFGRTDLNDENLGAHIAQSVAALAPKIEHEMEHCLCYGREREPSRPVCWCVTFKRRSTAIRRQAISTRWCWRTRACWR
jgi:hypothetical protein